jgi:hypothetical protein
MGVNLLTHGKRPLKRHLCVSEKEQNKEPEKGGGSSNCAEHVFEETVYVCRRSAT